MGACAQGALRRARPRPTERPDLPARTIKEERDHDRSREGVLPHRGAEPQHGAGLDRRAQSVMRRRPTNPPFQRRIAHVRTWRGAHVALEVVSSLVCWSYLYVVN